jgi:dUTP pyrophosphatase
MITISTILEGNFLPQYASPGAAGADIRTPVGFYLAPGQSHLWPLGIRVEIPEGYEGQLRLRSSLGKRGLTIPQGFGTIDSDYRGPLFGLVYNISDGFVEVEANERVFQLVIAPVVRANFKLAYDLSETQRGDGGFGSTGR